MSGLIDNARAIEAREPARRIDYDRMNRERRSQKSALTRAINSGNPDTIAAVCKAAVAAWDECGAWPDDWSRWQRALDDALPVFQSVRIENL